MSLFRINPKAYSEARVSGVFTPISLEIEYPKGAVVMYDGVMYSCMVEGAMWLGKPDANWSSYPNQPFIVINSTAVGSIDIFSSYENYLTNADMYAKLDTEYKRVDHPDLYSLYQKTMPELIIDEDTFRTPKINLLKPTFNKYSVYGKGEIVYIEPDTYDEITLPAGTHVNHLGKSVTYQAETKVKRYAVKVRSTKDNNNSDPVATLGTDWVIDQPNDIVEEGTNVTNGVTNKIRLYAGNRMFVTAYKTRAVGAAYRWVFPLKTVNAIPNLLTSSPFYEVGSSSSYYSTGFDNLVANTSIVVKTWIGSTSVTDPIFLSLEDVWY